MDREIHIGRIIKGVMDEQGRKATWLAARLNCDVSNVYKIFKKAHIDILLLIDISIALETDFFAIYSDYLHRKSCQPRHK